MLVNVLFVCSGNTCRSPMAAILARHLAAEKGISQNYLISSAGIHAAKGIDISPEAKIALENRGIKEISHKSRLLGKAAISAADLLFTMERQQAYELRKTYPEFAEKIFPISVLDQRIREVLEDVDDPIGNDQKVYDKTLKQIEKYVQLLLKENFNGQ